MSASRPPSPRIGSVIGGRYQVVERLGQGGQSVVYRGLDLREGDAVALKVLKGELAKDPDFRERMFREARALTALQNTAALRVYDQQWTDDGALCLVTELLHGIELDDWLKRREVEGSVVTLTEVIDLLGPIVSTLDAAHREGIVHRDLKPENIFVLDAAQGGGVRLLDFGFAKFVRLRGFTADGLIAGSPSYIAPEAWQGLKDLDHRLDVYALGAVIYRCLAGEPPFGTGDLGEMLRRVTTAARPSLRARRPDLPAEMDEWVHQALAIDRDDRFARTSALWSALCGIARQ